MEMYKNAVTMGIKKANSKPHTIFLLGMLAGCHIGFGMLLAMTCGGDMPGFAKSDLGFTKIVAGLFGLPFGLYMVVVTGSDLFTSNVASVLLARMDGKVTTRQLIKSWVISYAGNLVGSVILAWLVHESGVLMHPEAIIRLTTLKASLTFKNAFFRGLLCNWLVCTAVFMTCTTKSIGAKFICVLGPICIFVAETFDHCVANMLALPLGLMTGAKFGLHGFIVGNLIPVTLGNIIGGALPVAMMMYMAMGEHGAFDVCYGRTAAGKNLEGDMDSTKRTDWMNGSQHSVSEEDTV